MADTRLALALILVVVLTIGFHMCGRRFSSPVVFFIIPFIIQALNAFLYYPWNISYYSMFLIAGGSIVFVLSAATVHYFATTHFSQHIQHRILTKEPLMRRWQYLLLITVTLGGILVVYRGIKSSTGIAGSNFSDVLGEFNAGMKSEDSDMTFGALPSLIYNLLCGAVYAYAYLLAATIKRCKKKDWLPPTILFMLGTAGILVSGSRTDVIGPIIGFIVILLMLNEQGTKRLSLKHIPLKYYTFLILLIIVIILIFQLSVTFIGRDIDQTPADYLSTYIAAPIQNFDYMNTQSVSSSDYFGGNTFKPLYRSLQQVGILPAGAGLPRFGFLSRDGYFMGNVYTIYYALLLDFGVGGTMIAIAVMAIIMQLLYEASIRRMNPAFLPILPIVYALMTFYMFMSFFSTNFFQNTVSTGFLKALIGIIAVTIYQHLCCNYIIAPKKIGCPGIIIS